MNTLVKENLGWSNVVEDSWFNRLEIGVIILNCGYPEGTDRFSKVIHAKSTSHLYPDADMLKKYVVTVHIHSGYKMIETKC